MKNKTVLIAAVFAVATVLAAGLTVLPSSVQDAKANPCSDNTLASAASDEQSFFEDGDGDLNAEGNADQNAQASNIIECDLTGVVINEETEEPSGLTEEEAAEEAAEEAEDAEFE